MKTRICVVGAGRWGKNHIKTLDSLGNLAGIVESDENTCSVFQEKYPGVKIFSNIKEAIAEDFDGFTVATPAETHFEIAEYIIKHGKHVLVEKPIALKAQEARKLNDMAQEMGVQLMVGHVLLFHPAIHRIKDLMDEGKVGKIEYVYTNRVNLGTVRTEENILWSFATHDISIFQYFFGTKPLEVHSSGGAFLQPHIHDTTMTTFRYPDNIVGHNFVSWLHPFKEHRIVVIGSKGMLSYEDSSEQKDIYFYEKGIDWVQGEPIKRDGPTEVIPYEKGMPLNNEMQYFIDHIESGEPVTISDGKNAIEVLEILEWASESLLKDIKKKVEEKPSFKVHESAYVDKDVTIGEGSSIWHFSHIQSNTKIGSKVTIGQNVNVGNNVTIGDFVKIQNNVSVYEGVTLEDYVFCGPSMVFTNVMNPRCKYPQRGSEFYHPTLVKYGASIGANATIVCGHTIGRHAFIAAGAVVASNVPDFALMMGVPAKRKGWMCECGQILPEIKGSVRCPKCGIGYRLDGEKLTQIKD